MADVFYSSWVNGYVLDSSTFLTFPWETLKIRETLVRRPDWLALRFSPALNKHAHPSSQPANPFVVRAGQLDVALSVLEGLVAQPFLQHGDRNSS